MKTGLFLGRLRRLFGRWIINGSVHGAASLLSFCVFSLLLLVAPNFPEWEGLKMANASEIITREAYGAGRWFPGTTAELKEMVDTYIADARPESVGGRIVAAIAPHAGYVYSGGVAGFTFRAIKDNALKWGAPETVVVLGFSHRGGFRGVAVMDGGFMETPLGKTPLDNEAVTFLTSESPRIFKDYRPHQGEHSAENEIPFVQEALPESKLVVALMGDHDPESLNALVAALNDLNRKKRILVVASTDMLHDASYELVSRTDRKTLETLAAMDSKGLAASWGYDKQIFCGIGPVLTAMAFARDQGCRKGSVLYYRNSGDDFPESRDRWVVGYGAAVFSVAPKNQETK